MATAEDRNIFRESVPKLETKQVLKQRQCIEEENNTYIFLAYYLINFFMQIKTLATLTIFSYVPAY